MKTTKTLIVALLCCLASLAVYSQSDVTPNTPNVTLYCADGILDLGDAPANTEWKVFFSRTQDDTPSEGVILTGNTIPSEILQTGYYYVLTVGDATHPEICESALTEIPVYKFAPLSVTFTAEDFCIEQIADQSFTAVPATTDSYATDNLVYQWYTVTGGVETALTGAASSTYTPKVTDITPDIVAGTTVTYRVKVGYEVEGLRYCSTVADDDVTVTATPSKPSIIITGATGEDW